MNNKRLLIWIPLAALLCNGLGYVIVSTIRSSSRNGASVATMASGTVAPPLDPRSDDSAKEEIGRARRAAGLAALEAGDYGKALINFTEARTLLGERARVDELLHVTEDLRTRSKTAQQPEPAPPSLPPAPMARFTPPAIRAPFRPAAPARPSTPEPVASEPHPTNTSGTGLLLVTTTPRGLLVQVDGSPVDLTPMRVAIKPGTHRVTLLDGDRHLYETSVEINEGNPTTILRDLSAEMAPDARSAVVAASVKDDAVRPATNAPPAPDPVAPQAAKPVLATDPGGLDITSPGLYGMVWVNGRPQGYPPVRARDLPPGPTKIEVRVNGVEKRSTTVVVQPGVTSSVKLR